jgi:hypothetical protein
MPLAILLLAGCLADIRPDALVATPVPDAATVRGRAVLEAAAEAHGGIDAWQARETVTVEMTDSWRGMFKLFSPWPSANVTVRLEQRLHTFDSRATFSDADNAGLVWGISDWKTWEEQDGEGARVRKNKGARFMLPTMHYFTELPYRILEAPILVDVGEETVGGVVYDRVFATWESVEPTAKFDQYIVYVDRSTGRIAKTHYTVRELGGFITGTMHYEDYVQVDGAWLPMTMVVTAKPTDTLADYMHRATVSSWTFEAADPSAFVLPAE